MSAESFRLKIFNPAGLLFDEQVVSVTLPGADGEIGLLPMHARYVGLLGTGVLKLILLDGGAEVTAAACGGFCSFSDDAFVILAERIEFSNNVNKSAYGSKRNELQKIVDTASHYEAEWKIARSELDWIEAVDKLFAH